MNDVFELTVSATASGCIYALIALAYLIILRPTSIINFAIGEWAAVGAFIGVAVLTPLIWPRLEGPYWLAILAVLVVLGVLGWLVETSPCSLWCVAEHRSQARYSRSLAYSWSSARA